jgi:NAD+ synthase (glutamine-hydrolysing)
MKYGFIKTAAATPHISVANPSANAAEIISLMEQANTCGVELLVFPELCMTGYTCGELFLSDVLMHSAGDALNMVCKATVGKKLLFL